MKQIIGMTFTVAACSSIALAQAPGRDVAKIVEEVNDTALEATRVTYKFEYSGTGALKDRVPVVEGEAKLMHVTDPEDSMYVVIGQVQPVGEFELDPVSFHYASDGKHAYSVDTANETFTWGELPAAQEVLGYANYGLMIEFMHPGPFHDEMEADSLKLEGEEKIGDVMCDIVYVVYAENRGETRWWFGQEDHLPRAVERIWNGGQGTTLMKLTEVNADAKFNHKDFTLSAPKGYKTVEFQPPKRQARPELLAVGAEAPDWSLQSSDGEEVTLSKLRGNIVVMDFWATWCGPCKRAMPGIQKLHEEFKAAGAPVKILGINTWESPDGDPAKYMKEKEFTYGLLMGGDDVATAYKVTGIPTFYVIGQDGTIIHREVGFKTNGEELLKEVIEKALAENDG